MKISLQSCFHCILKTEAMPGAARVPGVGTVHGLSVPAPRRPPVVRRQDDPYRPARSPPQGPPPLPPPTTMFDDYCSYDIVHGQFVFINGGSSRRNERRRWQSSQSRSQRRACKEGGDQRRSFITFVTVFTQSLC